MKHLVTLYLLIYVRSGVSWKPLCVEEGQLIKRGIQIAGPHVFGSVNSEPSDAPTDEVVHVVTDLVSNPSLFAFQVT
jgi:hypothetical protein